MNKMLRVAFVALGVIAPAAALVSPVSSAGEGPPTHSTTPPAPAGTETFVQANKAPDAGQIFIAYVLTRDETARATYVSLERRCSGAVVSKHGKLLARVPAHLTTFPEDAAIPAVEVLSFKIPRRYGHHPTRSTVGKYFGYSCTGTSDRITSDDGHIVTHIISHADGIWPPPPMWPIQD
jgi:hypothetical protein